MLPFWSYYTSHEYVALLYALLHDKETIFEQEGVRDYMSYLLNIMPTRGPYCWRMNSLIVEDKEDGDEVKTFNVEDLIEYPSKEFKNRFKIIGREQDGIFPYYWNSTNALMEWESTKGLSDKRAGTDHHTNGSYYAGEMNGLDYMLLYNLYHLFFQDETYSQSYYRNYGDNLFLTNYTVSQEYEYFTARAYTDEAGIRRNGNITVDNTFQIPAGRTAIMRAGHSVQLRNGFTTNGQGNLGITIDNTTPNCCWELEEDLAELNMGGESTHKVVNPIDSAFLRHRYDSLLTAYDLERKEFESKYRDSILNVHKESIIKDIIVMSYGQNNFIIQHPIEYGNMDFILVNSMGQVIKRGRTVGGELSLYLNEYPSGVYAINLSSDNFYVSRKVVLIH